MQHETPHLPEDQKYREWLIGAMDAARANNPRDHRMAEVIDMLKDYIGRYGFSNFVRLSDELSLLVSKTSQKKYPGLVNLSKELDGSSEGKEFAGLVKRRMHRRGFLKIFVPALSLGIALASSAMAFEKANSDDPNIANREKGKKDAGFLVAVSAGAGLLALITALQYHQSDSEKAQAFVKGLLEVYEPAIDQIAHEANQRRGDVRAF